MNEGKNERTNERMDGWMARWGGDGRRMSPKDNRNSARLEVLTAALERNQIFLDYKQLLWLLHPENDGNTTLQNVGNCLLHKHQPPRKFESLSVKYRQTLCLLVEYDISWLH